MTEHRLIESRREELESRDADETVAFITEMYSDNALRFWKAPPQSRVRTSATVWGEVVATEIRSTIGYSCQIAPLRDQVYFERSLRGRARLRGGGHDLHQHRNDLTVFPHGVPIRADCDSHDVNLLHIPHHLLTDLAAQSGIEAADFRFTSLEPRDQRSERFWGRLFDLTHHELSAPDSPVLTELVLQNLTRTLAAAALAVFPNTTMDLHLQSGPGTVGASGLERAIEFLHANPAQPITVVQLAAHADTSVRALQNAFRAHHATTPLEYLRRIRLERARHDLLAAEPSDGLTVSIVAARWGFTNPGRFAQQYKQRFGHSPRLDLHH
ncbi:AraC family transcriptional regulator [Nocardia jejuensis]|uniref:AraC family transcriptional regulator n=1 Tax=Nocardia jejuensis TaxID=328049 RepID=UPI000A812386|nr:helix-turn-helix domain-containing protein [Nocardia jejuensis]